MGGGFSRGPWRELPVGVLFTVEGKGGVFQSVARGGVTRFALGVHRSNRRFIGRTAGSSVEPSVQTV